MEITPIVVKSKPGPKKQWSWHDNFFDEFQRRMRMAEGRETLQAECGDLADWLNDKKKIAAAGDDHKPITANRVRELYRSRGGSAKIYRAERQTHIDRLLKASRAFLAEYQP